MGKMDRGYCTEGQFQKVKEAMNEKFTIRVIILEGSDLGLWMYVRVCFCRTEAYLGLHFKKSLYEKFRIKTPMPFYHTILRIYPVLCSHLLHNREKRRMMAETEHKFYNMK